MTVPSIFEGRTSALVWPPMPVRVDCLIPGRWAQPSPFQEGARAVATTKSELLANIAVTGQRKAITARFEIHPRDWSGWAVEWPKLNLFLHPRVGGAANSVADVLASRLFIYEGNHRWAIGKMLGWGYVLVEPQLWIYEGVTHGEFDDRVKQQSRLLHRMAPAGYPPLQEARQARPRRSDLRPIDPEMRTPPFDGCRPDTWRPE